LLSRFTTDKIAAEVAMDVFDAIANRHSYRAALNETPVSREDLRRIVQAGIQAPSGYNAQSSHFVIVDDPGLVREVLGSVSDRPVMQTAPAAIVVVTDPNASRNEQYSFGVQDYAASVENMLLAATALGYASLWVEGQVRRTNASIRIAELLRVPEPFKVVVVLPVGVPVESKQQKPKKPFEKRASFNAFGTAPGSDSSELHAHDP